MISLSKKLTPLLIISFLGFLYLKTIAPGLTWAYDGADGGDLLSALATGGIPHPSGYPTYLIFASLFTKLPLGSLAFRGNLFSSISMLLAVYVLFQLIIMLTNSYYVATMSSLLFGTFPLVWSQALITEIYALQTLLVVLVLYVSNPENHFPWRKFAGGLILGLAIGNHLTAIFLLPITIWGNTRIKVFKKGKENFRSLTKHISQYLYRSMIGLTLGFGVFIIIPLRARNQAPVNWGDAVDWNGFWWLISGNMYHGRLSHISLNYLASGIRLWSQFLLDQMGILGLTIALIYIIVFFKSSFLHNMTVWLALVFSLFAIFYYSPDSYVYLIFPLLAFAIWIGLGCKYLLDNLPTNISFLKPAFATISIAYVIANAIWLIPNMDISMDRKAEGFAQAVIENLPSNAIMITRGDESLFSLWYFHFANGQRPDISIISRDLSIYPWYRRVLSETYPQLFIPDKFSVQNIKNANQHRSVCKLEMELRPQLICLNPDG